MGSFVGSVEMRSAEHVASRKLSYINFLLSGKKTF